MIGISTLKTNYNQWTSEAPKDIRGRLEKIISIIKATVSSIFLKLISYKYRLFPVHFHTKLDKPHSLNKDKKSLFVLVHGINDDPCTWKKHYKTIKLNCPDAEVIAPIVTKRGNCSLEEATQPIKDLVQGIINKNPGIPVVFIGHSNGARVVTKIASELDFNTSALKISTIAGLHFGTKKMDYALQVFGKKIISFIGYSSEVIDEFQYASPIAKNLVNGMQKERFPANECSFYCSPDDTEIVPQDSAYPKIAKKIAVKYYQVLGGYGHRSIVEKIASHQINDCKRWIEEISWLHSFQNL